MSFWSHLEQNEQRLLQTNSVKSEHLNLIDKCAAVTNSGEDETEDDFEPADTAQKPIEAKTSNKQMTCVFTENLKENVKSESRYEEEQRKEPSKEEAEAEESILEADKGLVIVASKRSLCIVSAQVPSGRAERQKEGVYTHEGHVEKDVIGDEFDGYLTEDDVYDNVSCACSVFGTSADVKQSKQSGISRSDSKVAHNSTPIKQQKNNGSQRNCSAPSINASAVFRAQAVKRYFSSSPSILPPQKSLAGQQQQQEQRQQQQRRLQYRQQQQQLSPQSLETLPGQHKSPVKKRLRKTTKAEHVTKKQALSKCVHSTAADDQDSLIAHQSASQNKDKTKSDAELNKVHCCYIVYGNDRTYVGYTTNPQKRLRQHNGEIKGGARSSRAMLGDARFLALVFPFADARAALQFEWAMKNRKPNHTKLKGRAQKLCELLCTDRWTSNCDPTSSHPPLSVCWFMPQEALLALGIRLESFYFLLKVTHHFFPSPIISGELNKPVIEMLSLLASSTTTTTTTTTDMPLLESL